MEEVSNMMAYDAQVMEQMSEEEILACLVSETEPKFTVRVSSFIYFKVKPILQLS